MYLISVKHENGYKAHSIYSSFKSMKMAIMDIVVNDEMLYQELKAYPDEHVIEKTTYVLDNNIKIDIVENRITSKIALENIKRHIDVRFANLLMTPKKICFPRVIIDQKAKESWIVLDGVNYINLIKHLEAYVETKIREIKSKKNIRYGILNENTPEYTAVKFTDSKQYINNKNTYCIVVSPGTGYTTSLTL